MKPSPEQEFRRDARMHPVTLRFASDMLESQFTRSWTSATLLTNRIWSGCALGFYLLYTLVLWRTIESPDPMLLWLRLGVVVPLIVISAIPLYSGRRLGALGAPAFFLAALAAFVVATVNYRLDASPWNILSLLEMAVIFAYGQHYNRIRFTAVIAYSLACVSALGIVTALTPDSPAEDLVPLLPFACIVAALTGIGVLASFSRETFIRRNYVSIRALRLEKDLANAIRLEAEQANLSKSRFLAIMSHELRTPLNAIIGYSEMMKLGIIGEVQPPRAREYIEIVLDSGRHLLSMVNDVLDLSRSEAGRVRVEEETIHVGALLATTVRELAPRAEKGGHRLTWQVEDQLPDLRADPRLLHQMLSNLLTNALKFTPGGGRVDCRAALNDEGEMVFTVRDSGVGIAADKLERIFQPFEQVDDGLDRRNDGVGLGLPLTRGLVEAHGGRIAITSTPGRGTTVRLVFPAIRVTTGAVAAA
ncbi:MAG: HAMP domain-containing sensor histidine kinase [Pseudomonadota bacterium]|nr:HAMP domain-containing sensor histidine kinase [Pseudomonadota bacterium]